MERGLKPVYALSLYYTGIISQVKTANTVRDRINVWIFDPKWRQKPHKVRSFLLHVQSFERTPTLWPTMSWSLTALQIKNDVILLEKHKKGDKNPKGIGVE